MSPSEPPPDDAAAAGRRYNVVEDIGLRIRFTFPDLLAIDDHPGGTDDLPNDDRHGADR